MDIVNGRSVLLCEYLSDLCGKINHKVHEEGHRVSQRIILTASLQLPDHNMLIISFIAMILQGDGAGH